MLRFNHTPMKILVKTFLFSFLFFSLHILYPREINVLDEKYPEDLHNLSLHDAQLPMIQNNLTRYREIARVKEFYDMGWIKEDSIHKSYISGENLDYELHFVPNDSGWSPTFRHTFLYNDMQNLTRKSIQRPTMVGWYDSQQIFFTYQPASNLILNETSQTRNIFDGSWLNGYQNVYIRNTDGNLDTLRSFGGNGTDWVPIYQIIYTWKDASTLEYEVIQSWNERDNQWGTPYRTSYFYTENGPDTSIIQTWNDSSAEWVNFQMEVSFFNNNGLEDSIFYINWDAEKMDWVYRSKTINQYSSGGTLIQVNDYRWGIDGWFNFMQIIYELDPFENVERATRQLWDFTINSFTNLSRTTYYYEAYDESSSLPPVDEVIHEVYPNPFNEKVFIQFQNPQSELAELVIYNLAGQEVFREKKSEYSFIWDGRSFLGQRLSAGMYTYRLRVGDKIGAGKVFLLGL
jgi:hypothetical protein